MEDLVADWQLGRVISAGQLADVREATSETRFTPVAIKRLHTHAAGQAEVRALFESECRLTCSLPPSPHLVHGLHAELVGARPYLVMPLYPGQNLRARLDRGPVVRADAIRLVASAAAGLAQLHEFGWVHGDVTPFNLLCDPVSVLLCDLGVARPIGAAGLVRGTAAYMAPEQVRGQSWTAAVDVFALGVLLWELIQGERLFHRGASFLSMAAVVESAAPTLDDLDLAPLAGAALSKDPSARPSAAELVSALQTIHSA